MDTEEASPHFCIWLHCDIALRLEYSARAGCAIYFYLSFANSGSRRSDWCGNHGCFVRIYSCIYPLYDIAEVSEVGINLSRHVSKIDIQNAESSTAAMVDLIFEKKIRLESMDDTSASPGYISSIMSRLLGSKQGKMDIIQINQH